MASPWGSPLVGGELLVQQGGRAVQLLEASPLGDPAVNHDQDLPEMLAEGAALQCPDHAATVAALAHLADDPALRAGLEDRQRIVEDQDVGPLEQRAGDRELLPH